VLVLAPPSLTSQWFVELLRRFNLPFALFDEERCEAIEVGDAARNPFEDEQFVVAAIDWLSDDPSRAEQIASAPWDLVVVDEAHHLEWTPEHASPAYALVEKLSASAPGLILLTATPQQLGRSGHFARLRLLDPARYSDLDAFIAESDGYVRLSTLASALIDGAPLTSEAREQLADVFSGDDEVLALLYSSPLRDGEIVAGKFHPFSGPIKGNDGTTRVPAGKTLSDKEIDSVNWYVEGVEGKVPGK